MYVTNDLWPVQYSCAIMYNSKSHFLPRSLDYDNEYLIDDEGRVKQHFCICEGDYISKMF